MKKCRRDHSACFRLLSLTVVFLALYITYFIFHLRTQLISSDITTMFPLLCDAMNGNILLRGWVVGTNSFLFTDTLWCIPGMLLKLSYAQIMAYTAALFRAGAIVLLLAGFAMPERKSDYVGLAFFVLSMLVCPTDAIYTELNLNSHNGTYFTAAIEFLALKKYLETEKRGYLAFFTVFGALIFASDSISLMVLFGPAVLVGAYYALIGRRRKIALSCAASAALCVIAGRLLNMAVEAYGGLEVVGLGMQIISEPAQLAERAAVFLKAVGILIGFKPWLIEGFSLFGLASGMFIAVIFVLALVNCGLALVKKAEYKELALSVIVLANAFCFIFTNVAYAYRYTVPYMLFGALLLTLTVNRALSKLSSRPVKLAVSIILLLLTVFCDLKNAYTVSLSYEWYVISKSDEQAAARYINEYKLGNGYGDFWSASLLSCYADFDSMIYQVFSTEEGFFPYTELINREWYFEDDIHYAVVYADDERNQMCKKADIVGFAGEPDEDYIFGEYELLWYEDDLSKYIKGNEVLKEGLYTYGENWPFFSNFEDSDGRLISDDSGALVYGPYYIMPAGEYSITFYYSSELKDNYGKGIVDVFSNSVNSNWDKYVLSIDPVADSVTIDNIVLRRQINNFEVRMFVNSPGVEIKSIEITKTG